MGDSSPKNAQKKSAQKQVKRDHDKQAKQNAILAKQSPNKKK